MTKSNNKAEALREFLEWCHADDYHGTDDDMSDACDNWIASLEDDEIAALAVKTFKEGI